jgi:hypothetical protein
LLASGSLSPRPRNGNGLLAAGWLWLNRASWQLSRFANGLATFLRQTALCRGARWLCLSGIREISSMTALIRYKSLVRVLVTTLALLGTSAVMANEVSDLDARAAAEYNRGLDARDAGQNGAACQHFRNSAVLYENSIYAMMSHSMRTEEDRDVIKRAADQQQGSANGAKARAKEVCGRPDGPALTSSAASSASNDVDWNAEKKLDLQRTRKLAVSQYTESNRLWDAGDRPGACAAIRLSTDNFAKVTAAMKANPALESAFTPVAQHYADEAYVIELRDKTFCAG